MTKIKLCGLSRAEDINAVNSLLPEYIGFVFAKKSKRFVSLKTAAELKRFLDKRIQSVGVFVNATPELILTAVKNGIIDVIQLHGSEDEDYIKMLKNSASAPIIKAFVINSPDDLVKAEQSVADYILLDGGKGEGRVFDWSLLKDIRRPYFLAGGLDAENVGSAVSTLHPYAVDVSSGIETNGKKDLHKMTVFVSAVRKENEND